MHLVARVARGAAVRRANVLGIFRLGFLLLRSLGRPALVVGARALQLGEGRRRGGIRRSLVLGAELRLQLGSGVPLATPGSVRRSTRRRRRLHVVAFRGTAQGVVQRREEAACPGVGDGELLRVDHCAPRSLAVLADLQAQLALGSEQRGQRRVPRAAQRKHGRAIDRARRHARRRAAQRQQTGERHCAGRLARNARLLVVAFRRARATPNARRPRKPAGRRCARLHPREVLGRFHKAIARFPGFARALRQARGARRAARRPRRLALRGARSGPLLRRARAGARALAASVRRRNNARARGHRK
mmetsp:Transcript_22016/g.67567  ORF Transcript_22016/g.67567 Transcript_22016/m.67567 type:complete len:303 (+) Transcript_22016:1751-2659(+)